MRNKKITLLAGALLAALVLSACASALQAASQNDPGDNQTQAQAPVEDETSQPASAQEVHDSPASPVVETEAELDAGADSAVETQQVEVKALDPDERPPLGAEREFSTDFSIHTVLYSEVLSGGPPKDGIPAVDDPQFISLAEADEWLEPLEPVVFVRVGEDARAYPIQVLMYHEIVNDVIGGVPLTVTFCPLCNTAIAFERTVGGEVLDFGTTGRLLNSNLIMYDRQTESWWQQASGEAIAGELTGSQLAFTPAVIISWEEFKGQFPGGKVLSRETGFQRPYGRNPYSGYDNINSSPFLFFGDTPDVLPPMARVLTVDGGEEAVAYPYDVLQGLNVINDTVAGDEIVVFWAPGTASALDVNTVAGGRDVGAASAFSRVVGDQTLTFRFDNGKIVDEQTSSQWNILGIAEQGELAGVELDPVVSINHFWFSWAAFKPETRIYQP